MNDDIDQDPPEPYFADCEQCGEQTPIHEMEKNIDTIGARVCNGCAELEKPKTVAYRMCVCGNEIPQNVRGWKCPQCIMNPMRRVTAYYGKKKQTI